MRYLLDTCTAIWATTDPIQLSVAAERIIENEELELFVSAVTVCEVAIKVAAGRAETPLTIDEFMRRLADVMETQWLPVDERAAAGVGRLPRIHKDPFDRLLVAQAIQHGMTILTPDRDIARYPAAVLW